MKLQITLIGLFGLIISSSADCELFEQSPTTMICDGRYGDVSIDHKYSDVRTIVLTFWNKNLNLDIKQNTMPMLNEIMVHSDDAQVDCWKLPKVQVVDNTGKIICSPTATTIRMQTDFKTDTKTPSTSTNGETHRETDRNTIVHSSPTATTTRMQTDFKTDTETPSTNGETHRQTDRNTIVHSSPTATTIMMQTDFKTDTETPSTNGDFMDTTAGEKRDGLTLLWKVLGIIGALLVILLTFLIACMLRIHCKKASISKGYDSQLFSGMTVPEHLELKEISDEEV